jgi:hypothetical protein
LERKLAAMLAADVVGYSALMEADEAYQLEDVPVTLADFGFEQLLTPCLQRLEALCAMTRLVVALHFRQLKSWGGNSCNV